MREKIKKLSYTVPIIVFLCFIFGMPVMTYKGPVQEAVENTKFTFGSYIELSDKFEGILQKNIFKKYGFINLNGRMARVLRINSLNGTQKLANGFLASFDPIRDIRDIRDSSEKVIALNKFLTDKGIYFLYLLTPRKNSIYDVQYAPGYSNDSYKNISNMINMLNDGGVHTFNVDSWFKENSWHTADIFFKTDHHWMPQAAIAVARGTMEILQNERIAGYDEEKLNDRNYKIKVLRNWFLGSRGRRVGKYYAGVDNLSVYFPKFKTNYSFSGLMRYKSDKKINWIYSNSILDLKYMKKKDYFETNPYTIYLYGDYPLQIIRNSEGTNTKRVLITGTSVRLPWQYFLTTQFQEIYSIDLRYYEDGTFMQYVEESRPDIVIMCVSAADLIGKPYEFGTEEYLDYLKKTEYNETILDLGNMEIYGSGESNRFKVVYSGLEANQAYTLTIDSTELSGVKNSFIQMTLENFSTNEEVYNRYFEANREKKQKWIFTTPTKGEDIYGIYIYAGVRGNTAKIRAKVNGIKLQKGIHED